MGTLLTTMTAMTMTMTMTMTVMQMVVQSLTGGEVSLAAVEAGTGAAAVGEAVHPLAALQQQQQHRMAHQTLL
jgi:hypothetical protein